MVKHIWSVLCRNSVVDADNNNLSLNEAIDEVTVSATTEAQRVESADHTIALPFEFEVTSLFYRSDPEEDESFQVVTEFKSPQGKALFSKEDKPTIYAGQKRVRVRIRSTLLPLTTSGTYIVTVELNQDKDKTLCAEIPVDIKLNLTEK